MQTLASWCVKHRIAVVVIWLAALIGAMGASQIVGTNYASSFSLPNTESTKAANLLQAASPKQAGDTEQIVVEAPAGDSVNSPAVKADVEAMLTKISALPHVASIISPYSQLGSHQVSKDGRIAFIRVNFDKNPFQISDKASATFVNTALSANHGSLHVAVAGQIAEQANKPSIGGTGLGVLLAAVVLLLVFGSIWAMVLPLVSALASLGTAIGLIGLLTHVLKMPSFSTELVVLIGLGVGVDYALFIVTRHRQGLIAGKDVRSSVITAVDTSGRAVLFAGIIVCIALLGMFALGVSFLYGLAIAAALGVAFTMIAALTLLPALLSFIGPRVLSRRQRRSLAQNGPRIVGQSSKGFWPKWADFMQRRPIVPALVALLVVVALGIPFFSLRLGHVDQGSDPPSTTTRQAYDLLARGFGPGFNGPLQLVAVTHGAEQQRAVNGAFARIQTEKGVDSVVVLPSVHAKDGGEVNIAITYPTTSPQDSATTDLIARLRSSVLPDSLKGTGATVYVGGITAIFVDFANVLAQKLPLFIGLVVLLSFILLAIVFRSLVVPLTAAVMNLLSIGAAFGVLVAVFQHGTMASLFGVGRPGPIEPFIPVMMFAILFGLSMDYEVFLVSRIHEEWLRSGDNKVAVRNGLAATGKTITAAALIMILVFGSFILGGMDVIKEFGLGLAGGIIVDAVFIRMAIVPAVMEMLGKANWWFPSWLDRILPRLSVEAASDGHEADVLEASAS